MTTDRQPMAPITAGVLARMRVPGMDACVIAAIDTLEAVEAENVGPIRERYASARERDIDPIAAPNAAIFTEPTK